MSDIILNLKTIHKAFDQKKVLKGIDLEIRKGMIMGLIGKNGAGKSTLIKTALGLLKPDQGIACLFGENARNINEEIKNRIGYVPQTMTGFRWMRVGALAHYIGSFYRHWDQKKVDDLFKEWEMDPWSKIATLSEGERQKLSIILAMGHDPDFYIFDEPVASLDPAARRKFIRQLIELSVSGNKTMLFSTHITSDLERIAADIALLKDRIITVQCDLANLKDRIRRLHIKALKSLPETIPMEGVLHATINNTSAIVTVDNVSDSEIKQLEKQLGASITTESLNLEEIFLELNR